MTAMEFLIIWKNIEKGMLTTYYSIPRIIY